ncbi:hypothetical protein I3843_05G053200 [Carya illinoinensis]|nr:hypothetical protein I3760_05G061100 [Carya illinoinensis]KAG7977852.1 hypothetical protein I3843_05G053200 [Carya illinoinensis]
MSSVAPSTALAYLDPQYWNDRFSNEEHYEWFKDYSHFRHLIQAHLKPNSTDVLFVDSRDPWNPPPATVTKVMATLKGVHRVLKPDGIFISISFGQPHFRRPLFDAPEFTWSVEWSTFGDGFHYFFYVLKKGKRSSDGKGSGESFEMPSICLLHEELESEDYLFRTNIDEMNN